MRSTQRPLWPRCICWLLPFLLWGAAADAENAGATPADNPSENAAMAYWKAIALLNAPQSAADLDTLEFIDQRLEELPPSIFVIEHLAGRWLLEDRLAMGTLRNAASMDRCAFPDDDLHGVGLERRLAQMKRLGRRALQAAKAYEYVDNEEGAATLYTAVFRMAEHLDQDHALKSGIVAAELVQSLLVQLEGFLSRSPTTAAVSVLTRYFASAPERLLHPADYLETAATQHADWLLNGPGTIENRLRSVYGNASQTPAVDQLMTLEPERKRERLTMWVEDYQARVHALAEAVRKPYQLGLPDVQEMDEAKKRMKDAPAADDVNPLVPLLVPTMQQIYERFLLAEGHMTMADLLCSAALYQADLKKWPKTVEEVSRFVGRPYPRDPFTGHEMQYVLKKRMPVTGIRAPRWLVGQPGMVYQAALAKRRKSDEELIERVAKEIDRKRRQEKIRKGQESMGK